MLHTSRTKPLAYAGRRLPAALTPERAAQMQVSDDIYDSTPLVVDNIEYLGLDYRVTIGGDDTLSTPKVLDRVGVPLIAIPRRWTRRPGHRVLHRLLLRDHPAPRSSSRARHTTLGRTSALACSASLAATGFFRALHGVRHVARGASSGSRRSTSSG